jgi:hypothetical protein
VRRNGLGRSIGRRGRSQEGGQGLVEFALALPIFILLLMSMIEYGFLYNNILTVQFAARQGVSAAAEAGANDGADCTILKAIETALTVPIDKTRITFVDIFQSDSNGDPVPGKVNHYTRTGVLDCPGSVDQPYTLVGAEGYPQTQRRETIAAGLDIVGVQIGYVYNGITPIGSGRSWSVSDGASLRMEPQQ